MSEPAVISLSGGQDSTTCLYWAKMQGFEPLYALTIDYGQLHRREVQAAKKIAEMVGCHHEVLQLDPTVLHSTSPLLDASQKVEQYESVERLPGGVEPTFIPGRNLLFLTIAANRAVEVCVRAIVIGVSQADYGGYFDCRQVAIEMMRKSLGWGIAGDPNRFTIYSPLMNLTKAQSVKLARTLPGCMEALSYSHTCYNGDYPPCGACHACLLRERGFEEAGVTDPLIERCMKEKR